MRLQITGFPYHIISRGNNRSNLFQDRHDYEKFLYLIDYSRKKFGLSIYSYVLMSNHIHLMVELSIAGTLAPAMEIIFKTYAHYLNDKYDRTGHVFENRYKSLLIQTDQYFFCCCRYIHLNPVRAKITENISEYQWSSYANLAYGKRHNFCVDHHDLYINLGKNWSQRMKAFRELVYINDNYPKRVESGRSIIGDKKFKDIIKKVSS